jgi:LmbE family N-acetylglucosaminyl deacetylase
VSEHPETVRAVGVELRTPVVVISTHLDDAVLSTGNLLHEAPGCTVLTVFAGHPPLGDTVTEWDASCGFQVGDDVIGRRRAEDLAALESLDAAPVWLDFLDSQYAPERPDVRELATAITQQIGDSAARTVLCPLGLSHSDHERVAAATSLARMSLPEVDWFAYGDLPFIYMDDGVQAIDRAVRQLNLLGVDARPLPGSAASAAKRSALECYPSQRKGLQSRAKLALRQEWYWRLVTMPNGEG